MFITTLLSPSSPAAAATPQNHHLHPAATIVQPHQGGAVSFLDHPKKGALVLWLTPNEGASGPGKSTTAKGAFGCA
ncbi:hypothetical protein Tco_0335621 [Tanacetum coccineum]